MAPFDRTNQEKKRKQFMLILTIICYGCTIAGFFRAGTLCWEMEQNFGNIKIGAALYTFIQPITMALSSILIALITRNVRKGIVFDTRNAQLITWVGGIVLIGGCAQYLFRDIISAEISLSYDGNPMFIYLLGMFIGLIGQIFHIGIRMKEEQDLTI